MKNSTLLISDVHHEQERERIYLPSQTILILGGKHMAKNTLLTSSQQTGTVCPCT